MLSEQESHDQVHRYLVEREPMYREDPAFEAWLFDRTAADEELMAEYLSMVTGYGIMTGEGIIRGGYENLPDPEDVPELVQQQFHSLAGRTREALVAASIEGASFSTGLVARLIRVDPEEVDDLLRPAMQAGLIVEAEGETMIPPVRPRHKFRPVQARKIIYESIPAADRAAMHREAVEHLAGCMAAERDSGKREMLSEMINEHHRLAGGPEDLRP